MLHVLNAQYTLFQSRSNLLRAQADLVNASYKLKSAIGQLTVADLGLSVEPYDPAINSGTSERGSSGWTAWILSNSKLRRLFSRASGDGRSPPAAPAG